MGETMFCAEIGSIPMAIHYDVIIIGPGVDTYRLQTRAVRKENSPVGTGWLLMHVGKRAKEPGAPGPSFHKTLAA